MPLSDAVASDRRGPDPRTAAAGLPPDDAPDSLARPRRPSPSTGLRAGGRLRRGPDDEARRPRETPEAGRRPRFSLVTAVYNVEPYLDEFIASLAAQAFDLDRVEVIAVNDGSTDGSLARLEAWAHQHPGLVRIVTQANGGQASARNTGLALATGEWVTFPDPDDILEPGYLRAVDRFAARHRRIEVIGTRPIILDEAADELLSHPRERQYLAGDRAVDLREEPNTFPGGTNIAMFRRERVVELGVQFDTKLRPAFEDVHFTASFIIGLPAPIVGIVGSAHYVYRRRAAGNSTLQSGWAHAGRYTVVPKRGHLDLIERARARDGSLPEWIQQLLVYDLSWYLSEYDKMESAIRMSEESRDTFAGLLAEILPNLDPEVVERHAVRTLKPIWVDVLGHGLKPEEWHSTPARTRVDREARLQRMSYRYAGERPREAFYLNGARVNPTYAKTMTHVYFGITLLRERVLWLPSGGDIKIVLDRRAAVIARGRQNPNLWGLPPSLAGRVFRLASLARAIGVPLARRRLGKAASKIIAVPMRMIARSVLYRARFRNAWVLMDRYSVAGDNGERLFEYLRSERRDINAWFVIAGDSPDWARMRAAGHDRLIRYRSFKWKMLMVNCEWFVSSHTDHPILMPPEIIRITGRRTWRFAFLQHGVTQADISRWLNGKDIDLFVTATAPETDSIVADGSGYVYTEKEVHQTGFPRFDRLTARARGVSDRERNLVLIAPTWRRWLTRPFDVETRSRGLKQDFWSSDYLRNWEAILRSQAIADAARKKGWRVIFVPHPEMQPVLEAMSLPSHIEPFTYAGNDVQALYAHCGLMVTDFSSVAFDAAYLDRPIVYFQFDREELLAGGHVGRPGYFDYERDGFGPIAETVAGAEAAILASIERGPQPAPEYQARIDATFLRRDGRACVRVVQAIESMRRPVVPSTIPLEAASR